MDLGITLTPEVLATSSTGTFSIFRPDGEAPSVVPVALDFNGVSDCVMIDHALPIATEVTIEMWLRGAPPQDSFLFYGTNDAHCRILSAHLPWSSGSFAFDAGDANGAARIIKEFVPVDADSWNHWVFIVTNLAMRRARVSELCSRRATTRSSPSRCKGLEETEKLVADVHIAGFNVDEGSTHWDGFVPPRQPQTFSVLLSIPEGIDEDRATIKLLQSRDSLLLLHEELEFAVSESGAIRQVN